MTDAEIRTLAAELLSDIAPETDPAALPGDRDIREELDIGFHGLPQLHHRAGQADRACHSGRALSAAVHHGRDRGVCGRKGREDSAQCRAAILSQPTTELRQLA